MSLSESKHQRHYCANEALGQCDVWSVWECRVRDARLITQSGGFLLIHLMTETLNSSSEFYTNTFDKFKQHHITFLAPDVESLSFGFICFK